MGIEWLANEVRTKEELRLFTAQELADLSRDSLSLMSPNDLAYLAVTGKIELPVRDALGAHLTRRFPDLTAAREYRRRDLAILRNGLPLAVIEGKLWISFEANVPSKLHHSNSKEGLVAATQSDILKMSELHQTSGCERFTSTVLFAADIRRIDSRHLPAIKYPNWHLRGLGLTADLETNHNLGVRNYLDAISTFGSTGTTRLFSGEAYGMTVLADVVICKISD